MSSPFSEEELAYLTDETPRLARVATVDGHGLPQMTPVGMWRHNPETGTVDVTGRAFTTTRKFRNVEANPKAAIVIDDLATVDPWRPRAVMIQGRAEAVTNPARPGDGHIRIHPDRVVSWGLDGRS